MAGVGFQLLQIVVSIKDRQKNADTTGDPWNGRTLEWSTPSPVPFYNYATIPEVKNRDAFWEMKQNKAAHKPIYKDIRLPKNSPAGLIIGILGFLFGFGMIWLVSLSKLLKKTVNTPLQLQN
jgi:cytochrome o ubiquinol oxidase subunit 1